MDRRKFIAVGGAAIIASQMTGAKDITASGKRTGDLVFTDGIKEENSPLKVKFLGTGAADWDGKDERGEERRFSSILIDDSVLMDFTRSNTDMLPDGCRVENIFYTHSHNDHYQPMAALGIGVKRVFVSSTWAKRCRGDFRRACYGTRHTVPDIIPMGIGQKAMVCGLCITALPANHWTRDTGEQTLIYLIEKGTSLYPSPKDAVNAGATRLLYATDTGGIMGRAAMMAGIDAHIPGGCPITALIMEATMGFGYEEDFRIYTHSSIDTVLHTVHVLRKTGRYLPGEGHSVWLTHLARTLHGTRAELDKLLPRPLKAAYDGLEISFGHQS